MIDLMDLRVYLILGAIVVSLAGAFIQPWYSKRHVKPGVEHE